MDFHGTPVGMIREISKMKGNPHKKMTFKNRIEECHNSAVMTPIIQSGLFRADYSVKCGVISCIC